MLITASRNVGITLNAAQGVLANDVSPDGTAMTVAILANGLMRTAALSTMVPLPTTLQLVIPVPTVLLIPSQTPAEKEVRQLLTLQYQHLSIL